MPYALAEFQTDQNGCRVPYGMVQTFCFILRPGSRWASAIVYSYWGSLEQREILHLNMKHKDAAGGSGVPLASIEEGLSYVRSIE